MFSAWGYDKKFKVPKHHWPWGSRWNMSYYTCPQYGEYWRGCSFHDLAIRLLEFTRDGAEGFPITVRFPVPGMLFYMKKTELYMSRGLAREFSSRLNKDLETFSSRSPRPEHRCIFLEGWGRGLVEELNIAWKVEKITIM